MSSEITTALDETPHPNEGKNQSAFVNPNPSPSPSPSLFTFRHLGCFGVMIAFSACGMVRIEDIAFVVFSVFYIIFLSKVAFPSLNPAFEPPIFGDNRLLGNYVLFAALVGLLLPIVFILKGIYEGDREGIEAAVPHLFLLASQVCMEGVTFSYQFSLPIRAFVPISYNTRRIFTIADWLRSETTAFDGEYGSSGLWLAVANLILWSYNLLGFLLPVYLPRVFKRYYGYKVNA